ncbi:hypothetical protein G6F33_009816 [Rhizopus arrhizus]|nr:hypothetical protein G6F33_009816 [Rhizopus arrhizus]
MVLGEEVTNANRVKCKATVDSYHPPLEVIYTSGEGNRRPFTIGKQVAARDPFTYHCYVDTPPSSPRIVNTVISNDEAINYRPKTARHDDDMDEDMALDDYEHHRPASRSSFGSL